MGEEISKSQYGADDFREFHRRLERETAQLEQWLKAGVLAEEGYSLGFELELWLVDGKLRPAPAITQLLNQSSDPLMVPELAAFNLEINSSPTGVDTLAASHFHASMEDAWNRAQRAAGLIGLKVLMIGILPSLKPEDLSMVNMSPMRRYEALNKQVMAMRRGKPLRIDIRGEDHLGLNMEDVMMEAACTSAQLHIKVPCSQAARAYNAAKILSAPMVALSANSPLAFERRLWDETRIPLFEQSIDVGASDMTRRVTFGIRYVRESIFEVFLANQQRYPVLVPSLFDTDDQALAHLRFHNGTIWRWNRPLIGFDAGKPHIRIEHRVMPSGPSLIDTTANAMVFFGALRSLIDEPGLEMRLPFETARDNFYCAARHSLEADLTWLDNSRMDARKVLEENILPRAQAGLRALGIEDADPYLEIARQRIKRGLNGAIWQREFLSSHKNNAVQLLDAYSRHQASDKPLHLWGVQ